MVKMTCPITGAVLHVADDQVEKFEKSGYKRVDEKPKRTARKAPESSSKSE